MSNRPDPPVDVRLHYGDDTYSDPLPVLYIGIERIDGVSVAVWEVCPPDSRPYVGVHVAVMPARTSLRIAVND